MGLSASVSPFVNLFIVNVNKTDTGTPHFVSVLVSVFSKHCFNILFGCGYGSNTVFLNKEMKDIRRDECWQIRSQTDILNAKIKECQQDTDCLLSIP